jgi:hypothetical protein
LASLAVAACDDPVDGDPAADADPAAADASRATNDAGTAAAWQTLLEGAWEIPAGTETYKCVYKTVAEDLYVHAFEAIIPLGTHHTVLTVGAPSHTDGVYDCNAGTNMNAQIHGSGVGTNPIEFPAGVAVKIEAGQQLLLNLHLFNFSDGALGGTSGTRIQMMAAADVVHEAESILMGKVATLVVPPGESTQVGTCLMNGDVTIFGMQPHMHQLGSHMKVVAESSATGDVVVWDAPYSFDEQIVSLVGPVEMETGDAIRVHCSYNNTTGSTVTFGDSSFDEMCFAGVYRYPVRGGTFGIFCAN